MAKKSVYRFKRGDIQMREYSDGTAMIIVTNTYIMAIFADKYGGIQHNTITTKGDIKELNNWIHSVNAAVHKYGTK